MPQQVINVGAVANDRTGDTWRDSWIKSNSNFSELYSLTESAQQVVVSSKSDFPAPVSGIITLLPGTQYLLRESVDLGTDRIVFSDLSSILGIDSLVVTLTYTGTGDMFTFVDTTARISYITIACPNGRVYNWSDTTTKVLRAHDLTISTCLQVGIFTGVSGVLRFTNHSASSVTTSGLSFFGNFRSVLYEIAAVTIAAGTVFDLGTATFDNITIDGVLGALNGSSIFVSGAASSANINAAGQGILFKNALSGTGTALSGITPDDSRWNFFINDDIRNTRPAAIVSMQANATPTTVAVAGTYALTAGTWVVEDESQFVATAAGRLTFKGAKAAQLLVVTRCTISPVSGGAQTMGLRLALNGAPVSNSTATATASAGSPTSITQVWQFTMNTDDYVEQYVTNISASTNVLVSAATLSAS